jgi:hypothetical protein
MVCSQQLAGHGPLHVQNKITFPLPVFVAHIPDFTLVQSHSLSPPPRGTGWHPHAAWALEAVLFQDNTGMQMPLVCTSKRPHLRSRLTAPCRYLGRYMFAEGDSGQTDPALTHNTFTGPLPVTWGAMTRMKNL